MNEVTVAFASQAEMINRNLRQLNVAPMRFDALAMLVEYSEGGQRYREGMLTAIVDNRGAAFQWSNENTIMFRAPAAEFEFWKPILDMIQTSREMNSQWLAFVEKTMGAAGEGDAGNTRNISTAWLGNILESRRRANAAHPAMNRRCLSRARGNTETHSPATWSAARLHTVTAG